MTSEITSFPIDHLTLYGKDDCDALIIRNNSYTYKMLNLRIATLSFWLRDQGLQNGERVAIWSGKGLISCIMPLAAARAGLIYVPINPLLKAPQVDYILQDSGAKMLIANAARLSSIRQLEHVNAALHDEKDIVENIEKKENTLPPSDARADDLAVILYTSGSTGQPKGVMLSHENLWLGAASVAQYLNLSDEDRTLAVLPLSFDFGQNQLLSTWFAGGTVVTLDYLTPKDVVKSCEKHRITTLAAIPPLWLQLIGYNWGDAAKAMKHISNSGGALTQTLVNGLRNIFKQSDIYAMYGLTEAFRSTYLEPELIDDNPLSIGKAIPYAEIMVVNDNGAAAKPYEHGELVHAGPLVSHGYWKDIERTAERFKPAPAFSEYADAKGHDKIAVWSGDTVYRDREGLLYFVGRDDAMIKTSGNRISPSEIETAAVATTYAIEACAVGQEDDRLGAVIILFVRQPHNAVDGDKEKLATALKVALPLFMQPKKIIWLDDFPKNANGKIDRNLLYLQLDHKA